jgi:hypothetical protein
LDELEGINLRNTISLMLNDFQGSFCDYFEQPYSFFSKHSTQHRWIITKINFIFHLVIFCWMVLVSIQLSPCLDIWSMNWSSPKHASAHRKWVVFVHESGIWYPICMESAGEDKIQKMKKKRFRRFQHH